MQSQLTRQQDTIRRMELTGRALEVERNELSKKADKLTREQEKSKALIQVDRGLDPGSICMYAGTWILDPPFHIHGCA